MTAQIHVRVSADFKRALKIYCAGAGITEQRWMEDVLKRAFAQCAPELAGGVSPREEVPVGLGISGHKGHSRK